MRVKCFIVFNPTGTAKNDTYAHHARHCDCILAISAMAALLKMMDKVLILVWFEGAAVESCRKASIFFVSLRPLLSGRFVYGGNTFDGETNMFVLFLKKT